MRRHALTPSASRPRPSAFTLMEVLIAIAIFSLGAIAVAAIFPAAIYLQRETVRDVQANHTAISAEAAIAGKRFRAPAADWDAVPPDATAAANTRPGQPGVSRLPSDALEDWPLQDRSSVATDPGTATRESYWVPLVYKRPGPSIPQSSEAAEFLMIYYFVLARAENTIYADAPRTAAAGWATDDPVGVPSVRQIVVSVSGNRFDFGNGESSVGIEEGFDFIVNAGDQVLDRFGNIYTVTGADNGGVTVTPTPPATMSFRGVTVDNDRLWCAPRGAVRHIGVMMHSSAKPLIVRE